MADKTPREKTQAEKNLDALFEEFRGCPADTMNEPGFRDGKSRQALLDEARAAVRAEAPAPEPTTGE